MNIVRELILWLETKTSYIAGTDMFQGFYPDSIEEGFLFVEISGSENESIMRESTVHITSMQVDYDTAHDTIHTLWDLLSYSKGLTMLDGTRIFSSAPLKYPSYINTTEHDKVVFTCSVTFYYEGE